MRNIGREVRGLDRTVGRGMASAGRNIERGLAVGVTAAAGGLALAVREAGNFEASLNTINTVAGLSSTALHGVGESLRATARDTGLDLDDLTAGYYDLVSAGIKAADAQGVLDAAVRLGIGGLATTAESIALLTVAINSYGGDASKAAEFADYFAQSVAAGQVTAAEIAASFATVGPLAANMGIEIQEVAAAYGQLTVKGETGASAMTAMAAAMIALQRTTGPMEELQRKLNINFAEMAGEKGLAATWQLIAEEAEKAGIPLIEYTGRQEALAYVLDVSGQNAAGYAQQLDEVRKAHQGEGVAARQMAERQQGLNFQLDRLKANVHDAAIEIGFALIPEMASLAGEAVDFLVDHRGDVKAFAQDLAAGMRDGVAWLKSIDWNTVMGTLQGLGGIGKGLLEAFLGMPSWVQIAVVSGWGLNKLTGGALGTIVGQLGSGLIKGILNMNAAVVNVNGRVVNAPGGPGGPVGGGNKGGPKFPPWLPGVGGIGLGTVAAPLVVVALATQGGSDKPDAEMENRRIQLARDLNAGVIDAAEAARLWAEAYGKTVANPFVSAAATKTSGSRSTSTAKAASSFDKAMLQRAVKDGTSLLPDTAMMQGNFDGLEATISDLPPIMTASQRAASSDAAMLRAAAYATVREQQRTAGSVERQHATLSEQARRLASIEGIEAGIARSSAIAAAKDPVTVVKLTTQTTVNLDGRTVASQTLYRLAAAGVDPAFRAPI